MAVTCYRDQRIHFYRLRTNFADADSGIDHMYSYEMPVSSTPEGRQVLMESDNALVMMNKGT